MTVQAEGQTQLPRRLRSFEACQIKTPRVLKWWLGRGMAPSQSEYKALTQGLTAGDPLADALAQRMIQSPAKAKNTDAQHDIEQTRSKMIANASQPPFDVDWALANRGAQFIHSVSTLATDVLRDMALMGGYTLSAFNQTLILTGELEKGAAPRLSGTSHWWRMVTDIDANRPGGQGFNATMRVRIGHAMVRNKLKDDSSWDGATYGLPINQVDMAATYLGFCLIMLLGVRKCGVWVTPAQSKAVMHLWKIIGWQMGVDAQWLVDNEKQAIVKLRQFAMTHTPPDESSKRLARALAKEPLSRNYSNLVAVRRQMAYLSHLSSCAYFLGPKLMKQLGISAPLGGLWKPVEVAPIVGRHYLGRLIGLKPTNSRQAQIVAIDALATK